MCFCIENQNRAVSKISSIRNEYPHMIIMYVICYWTKNASRLHLDNGFYRLSGEDSSIKSLPN